MPFVDVKRYSMRNCYNEKQKTVDLPGKPKHNNFIKIYIDLDKHKSGAPHVFSFAGS